MGSIQKNANMSAKATVKDVNDSQTETKSAKSGSMMAKANMVKEFNEKNNK